jgi:hypothetical protein
MGTYRVTATGAVAADDAEVFESVAHGGPITRTLPAPILSQGRAGTRPVGRVVHIADVDGNASQFPITVAPGAPGHLINGGSSYVIQSAFQCATFRRTVNGGWSISDDQEPNDATFAAPGSNVSRTAQARSHQGGVHVDDFMTLEEIVDVLSGTLLVDVSGAVQRAINYAIYKGSAGRRYSSKVIFFGGDYRLDSPIHAGFGTSFTSVTLQGMGSGTTQLWAMHGNAPCIAVQGARNTIIRGMGIYGINRAYNNSFIHAPTLAHLDAAAWVDPALPASANSRYAPYTGIAIDPYSGPRPEVSYPDVPYSTIAPFLGAVPQYGQRFSSRVWIDDCIIQGFVVGVTNQCSDADGNGDFTKITRCDIGRCVYGLSLGSSQARLTAIDKSEFHAVHTCIVTNKHGRQIGKPAVFVSNTELRLCIKWLDCPNTGFGGGPHFLNCYGEAMYQIGNVGAPADYQYPARFDHCEFSFSLWSHIGVPAYVFRNDGSGQVTFDGCSWEPSDNEAVFAFFGQRKAQSFRVIDCQFRAALKTEQYAKYAFNATLGLVFNQLSTDLAAYSARAPYGYNLATGVADQPPLYTETNTGNRDRLLPVYSKTARANINDPGFGMPHPEYTLGKSGKTFTIDGRDVTVDMGASFSQTFITRSGGDVGDIAWDSETDATFFITSRAGTTITMRAQSGFDIDGELLLPVTATGSLYFLNCRKYTPPYVTYCATTAGSAVATSVQRDDAFKAYIATEMPAGDALWVDPEVDHFISPASAAISAVDATAGTLTAAGNFRRTDPRHRLKLFVRAPAPNA